MSVEEKHWMAPESSDDPRPVPEEEDDIDLEAFTKLIQMRSMKSMKVAAKDVCPKNKVTSKLLTKRQMMNRGKEMLTIHISLNGILPQIWRRVCVSNQLPLSDFHRKVIVPAFGWATDYHGYMFMLKPFRKAVTSDLMIGTGFGPLGMGFNDMMHQMTHGLDIEDSAGVQVGDLFLGHMEAFYVYDLGDWFAHTLKLEEAKPGDENAALLEGKNACPPEDCGSNSSYAEILDVLDNPKHKDYLEKLALCNNARNYLQCNFHPYKFDLVAAKRRVRQYFTPISKPSRYGKPEAFACTCALCLRRAGRTDATSDLNLNAGDMKIPVILSSGGGNVDPTRRQTENITRGLEEYSGRRDGIACCAFCYDRECPFAERFKRCSKCHTIFYCSTECQKKDWRGRHKRLCQQEQPTVYNYG